MIQLIPAGIEDPAWTDARDMDDAIEIAKVHYSHVEAECFLRVTSQDGSEIYKGHLRLS